MLFMMLSALLYCYKRAINGHISTDHMESERKERSVYVAVWAHVQLWMSDLRTTAAHTGAVLNLTSTNVSCPLGGFAVFLCHTFVTFQWLWCFGGKTHPKAENSTLAWLKSDQTKLRWTNTLGWVEWESDYSCLYTPSRSAGFPPGTFEQKLKKKGNRRRGRFPSRTGHGERWARARRFQMQEGCLWQHFRGNLVALFNNPSWTLAVSVQCVWN